MRQRSLSLIHGNRPCSIDGAVHLDYTPRLGGEKHEVHPAKSATFARADGFVGLIGGSSTQTSIFVTHGAASFVVVATAAVANTPTVSVSQPSNE